MGRFAEALEDARRLVKGDTRGIRVDTLKIRRIPDFTPEEIKALRHAVNMPQRLFALCLGVTQKSVEAWEGGRSHPDGVIDRRGDFVRNFCEKRCLAVGHETPPAFLQMIDGRPFHMSSRLRSACATFTFQHGVWRIRLDGRIFDEFVVNLQRHAAADKVVDARRQIRRILH